MVTVIKKIKLINYKRFHNYVIEPNDRINILVGDNEVGKSSVLEAIDLVAGGNVRRVEFCAAFFAVLIDLLDSFSVIIDVIHDAARVAFGGWRVVIGEFGFVVAVVEEEYIAPWSKHCGVLAPLPFEVFADRRKEIFGIFFWPIGFVAENPLE